MKTTLVRVLSVATLIIVTGVFAQVVQRPNRPMADPFSDDPAPTTPAQPTQPASPAQPERDLVEPSTVPPATLSPVPGKPTVTQMEVVQPSPRMARGFLLREDGSLAGQLDYIDPGTLELHPVVNGVITFLQNRTVVAQLRSGRKGEFLVRGLTAGGVYSVFVTHRDWFAAGSVVVYAADPTTAGETGATAAKPFATLLASTQPGRLPAEVQVAANARLAEQEGAIAAQVLQMQMVPREDFVSALSSGVLGGDLGGPFGSFGTTGTTGGGSAGGGSGGGSGGGGGGGGGAGGALGAAGAAGIAAGIAAGTTESAFATQSSPFSP